MTWTNTIRRPALVLATLSLASCGGTSVLRDNVETAHGNAEALINTKAPAVPSRPLLVSHAGPYVSAQRVARSDRLWLHEPVTVRASRLPFDLCLTEALAQLSEPPSVAFAADMAERNGSITLDHRGGSFAEFLDLLADASGYGWEIRAGALYWMAEVTRIFEIRRVPAELSYSVTAGSDQQQQNAVQLGSGGSGSIRASPRGNAQISLTSAGRFWDDLGDTLAQLLGADDHPPMVDRATGTVVLRGNAGRVRRAGRYIATLNEWLGRQVLLEVQLVTVSLSDERSSGIDWSLIQNATAESTLDIAPTAVSNLAEIGAQALGISPPALGIEISGETHQWQGTSVILRALSAQGRTSVVNSPRLVVLNGQAAQLQVLSDRGILSGIDVITRESAALATEVQLQAGVVSTGISLTILPKIIGDEVFLHANIMMSDLVEVNTAGTAQQTIQLPTVERNQFFQSARLRTGQTLALGGLLENRAVERSESIARMKWLGARKNTTERTETVLLITPWLLDRPGPGEDAVL